MLESSMMLWFIFGDLTSDRQCMTVREFTVLTCQVATAVGIRFYKEYGLFLNNMTLNTNNSHDNLSIYKAHRQYSLNLHDNFYKHCSI